MTGLAGKTAIVTGAARGMGLEIATQLDAQGARLVLLDRNAEGVRNAAKTFRDARAIVVDVGDYSAVAAALADIEQIDVLINVAGGPINAQGDPVYGSFLESDPKIWDETYAVNLRGTANLCHICAARMPKGSRIVNIGSVAGLASSVNEAFYGACKAGVISLSKTLASALGTSHDISVNCVCPGPTDTPLMRRYRESPLADSAMQRFETMTPLKRMAKVQDIASAVMFFVTGSEFVSGQVLSVSGGW